MPFPILSGSLRLTILRLLPEPDAAQDARSPTGSALPTRHALDLRPDLDEIDAFMRSMTSREPPERDALWVAQCRPGRME